MVVPGYSADIAMSAAWLSLLNCKSSGDGTNVHRTIGNRSWDVEHHLKNQVSALFHIKILQMQMGKSSQTSKSFNWLLSYKFQFQSIRNEILICEVCSTIISNVFSSFALKMLGTYSRFYFKLCSTAVLL